MDTKIINDLASSIKALLPKDLERLRDDFSNNVKTILQNKLKDLNLVTREEFDVQTALLRRTREKLEMLEKKIS